ncbi:hypothetical protein [Croceimicrobium sp.]|uniref:hypothetical protein n=1 Tax=Croceimicrobium sp. TaxID=2828340 RepID=UPI003BACEFD1
MINTEFKPIHKPFLALLIFFIGISTFNRAQAQPYGLLSEGSNRDSLVCYVLDEMGSPEIPQDDQIIDSIKISSSKFQCPISQIGIVIHHPVLSGNDLSLELSFFNRNQIQDPRDDQWLYSMVWQGDTSQFHELRRKAPEVILSPGSFKLEKPKMLKIDLDSLYKAH